VKRYAATSEKEEKATACEADRAQGGRNPSSPFFAERVLPGSLLPPPILVGLALHCRRVGILHLEPIGRAVGAIGRALALGHDAFEPEFAGLPQEDLAVPMI
jgi:hypothetical protein